MGLLDRLRGEFIDIIEWTEPSQNEILAYRFPRYDNEIKNGAKLIVREGQAAAFVKEGQLRRREAAGHGHTRHEQHGDRVGRPAGTKDGKPTATAVSKPADTGEMPGPTPSVLSPICNRALGRNFRRVDGWPYTLRVVPDLQSRNVGGEVFNPSSRLRERSWASGRAIHARPRFPSRSSIGIRINTGLPS